jgi:hypothetical protein
VTFEVLNGNDCECDSFLGYDANLSGRYVQLGGYLEVGGGRCQVPEHGNLYYHNLCW